MDQRQIKKVLRSLGLYATARRLYHRLAPRRRGERARERAFYRELVRSGDLCFDIGANVGQTVELLRGLGARVVSVEPNPHCMRALHAIHGRSPMVHLEQVALGPEPGTAMLNFDGTEATGSIRDDWFHATNRERIEVAVRTLDDLIEQYGVPALCKVDVEGFEEHVFRGLRRPLPLVLFEFHANELPRACECLELIRAIVPIHSGRIATAEPLSWAIDSWLGYEALLEALGRTTLPYGNIAVRTVPAAP